MNNKSVVGTVIAGLTSVLALVSLIVFEVSIKTAQGYFDDAQNGGIIALLIVAAVFGLFSMLLRIVEVTVLSAKAQDMLGYILLAATALCLGFAIGMIVGAIATEFAFTYFSDFNIGTQKEYFIPAALTQAIVAVVMAIVAIVSATVANAFDIRK